MLSALRPSGLAIMVDSRVTPIELIQRQGAKMQRTCSLHLRAFGRSRRLTVPLKSYAIIYTLHAAIRGFLPAIRRFPKGF
jgi:hypothetical protein